MIWSATEVFCFYYIFRLPRAAAEPDSCDKRGKIAEPWSFYIFRATPVTVEAASAALPAGLTRLAVYGWTRQNSILSRKPASSGKDLAFVIDYIRNQKRHHHSGSLLRSLEAMEPDRDG